MPSIDRLVASRYTPTAPHPLARRPWHHEHRGLNAPTQGTMSERVHQRLAAADRTRWQRRVTRVTVFSSVVILLLTSEVVVLRWPQLGTRTVEWMTHKLGAALIVLAGLQRMRDGLLRPAEMSATAGVVTILLLILVAVGLGAVVWASETGMISMSHHHYKESWDKS